MAKVEFLVYFGGKNISQNFDKHFLIVMDSDVKEATK